MGYRLYFISAQTGKGVKELMEAGVSGHSNPFRIKLMSNKDSVEKYWEGLGESCEGGLQYFSLCGKGLHYEAFST